MLKMGCIRNNDINIINKITKESLDRNKKNSVIKYIENWNLSMAIISLFNHRVDLDTMKK